MLLTTDGAAVAPARNRYWMQQETQSASGERYEHWADDGGGGGAGLDSRTHVVLREASGGTRYLDFLGFVGVVVCDSSARHSMNVGKRDAWIHLNRPKLTVEMECEQD